MFNEFLGSNLIMFLLLSRLVFQTQAAFAEFIFLDKGQNRDFDKCQNNPIRLWHQNKSDAQYSEQVRLRLLDVGIASQIEAYVYGEIDACGNFYQIGFDFVVTIFGQRDTSVDVANQNLIVNILKKQALPYQVGNIRILNSFGEYISIYRDIEDIPEKLDLSTSPSDFEDAWVYFQNPKASSNPITKKVYVIIYDPLLSNGQTLIEYMNWNPPTDLMNQTIDFFYQTSGGLIHYTIEDVVTVNEWAEKIDGFRYTESEYLAVMNGQVPGHQPDTVNYNKIVNDPLLDICGKANRGEIDEVWVFNGPYFGFYESTLVGPGAYWFNSPPVPGPHTCNRLIPLMGPSPERGLAESIHNFGHRTESTLQKTFGSWEQNRTLHDWDRYALVGWLSPDYNYSGCGNIHYPPNGKSDYDYANTTIAMSNCDDFYSYPVLSEPGDVIAPVNCTKWNCEHLDFLFYWFEHLPDTAGCNTNGIANNWWIYFANPGLALTPSVPCQSSIFLPFVIR